MDAEQADAPYGPLKRDLSNLVDDLTAEERDVVAAKLGVARPGLRQDLANLVDDLTAEERDAVAVKLGVPRRPLLTTVPLFTARAGSSFQDWLNYLTDRSATGHALADTYALRRGTTDGSHTNNGSGSWAPRDIMPADFYAYRISVVRRTDGALMVQRHFVGGIGGDGVTDIRFDDDGTVRAFEVWLRDEGPDGDHDEDEPEVSYSWENHLNTNFSANFECVTEAVVWSESPFAVPEVMTPDPPLPVGPPQPHEGEDGEGEGD